MVTSFGTGELESEVSREPFWPAGEKVVAEELSPLLRTLDQQ
jgi:hypothetical protein